jgi:electron transfer flavoprotein alpha subunit
MTPVGDSDASVVVVPASEECLLVAVEPGEGPVATVGRALLAEGVRLAGELGVDLRAVTWTAEADLDAEAIAGRLAGMAAPLAPRAILLVDTDLGRQVAPLVAHILGTGAVLGCSDVRVSPGAGDQQVGWGAGGERVACGAEGALAGRDSVVFVKPVYGGWLEQEVEPVSGFTPVVTLVLDGLEPPDDSVAGLPGPQVLDIASSVPPRVSHLETVAPDARSVDLVHAKRIVAAGSGSASEKLLAAVQELADLLDGSVGATRPVVDEGRLPKERLIGQTGRTVNPELYLALGISGSPHHVAAVRGADRILSINRDTRAPIFQFSDVGYVGDLELVLPALVQRIKEWRDEPGGSE